VKLEDQTNKNMTHDEYWKSLKTSPNMMHVKVLEDEFPFYLENKRFSFFNKRMKEFLVDFFFEKNDSTTIVAYRIYDNNWKDYTYKEFIQAMGFKTESVPKIDGDNKDYTP